MSSFKAARLTVIPEEYIYQISLPLWQAATTGQGSIREMGTAAAPGYRIYGARVQGSSGPYLFAAGCIRKIASSGKSRVDMRSVVSSLNGNFFSAEQR